MNLQDIFGGIANVLSRRREKEDGEYRQLVRNVLDQPEGLKPEAIIKKLEETGRTNHDLLDDVSLLDHRRKLAEVAFEEDQLRSEHERLRSVLYQITYVRHPAERKEQKERQLAERNSAEKELNEAAGKLQLAVLARKELEETANAFFDEVEAMATK